MLTAQEIRRRYLNFFKKHAHEIVASDSLIPKGDPTLLFTNAGMVQFKKCFTGEEDRGYYRAASSQKCLRVSGKHNDLENVGRTARHHTFFEMLGNFSFGNYFKREAITWAWQFVTEELALPKEKLWVTVFRDDDEAFALWQEIAHLPAERIVRMGEKDNFWTMGDTGPCGPCSEIYIDQGEAMSCGEHCGIGQCDCDRFLEIWNLVFTQFDQQPDGTRLSLAKPNIDTGMGLERIAAVCQGKRSNFDCDLFQDIIQYAAQLAGVSYSFSAPNTNDVDTALRVIADHSRSAAFLIADGCLPSNEGRGYVLRRLLRRALRFATLMGVHEPFLYKSAGKVVEVMGEDYPELQESAEFITRVVREEEERFSVTLDKGLALLQEELENLAAAGKSTVSGAFCFKLYDTYGFPLDIVNDVAEKRGFSVDEAGFTAEMAEQKARARAAQKKGGLLGQGGGSSADVFKPLLDEGIHSEFVGYSRLECASRIIALLDADGLPTEKLAAGEAGYLVSTQTPFYGESGGQMGDHGSISAPAGTARVTESLKPAPQLIVLHITVETGEVLLDQEVTLTVAVNDRLASARNHTCTHLLHAALRRVLGTHVKQAGSLVGPDRLRFDFSHIAALTADELAAVERDVNRMILANCPVSTAEMSHDEALGSGAMALFGEKYGAQVRVVSVGAEDDKESVELCGGTHLQATGQAGLFCILSESGVAAGVRRIEAATGWNAYQHMLSQRAELQHISALVKGKAGELAPKVEHLQTEIKKLRKDLEKAASAGKGGDIMSGLGAVNGIPLLCAAVGALPVKALRDCMDDVRSKMPSGVACLAAADEGKVSLLLYVSKDLHGKFTAPALIKDVAACVGGTGGGRPDQAQAGGTKVEGIDAAFALLKEKLAQA